MHGRVRQAKQGENSLGQSRPRYRVPDQRGHRIAKKRGLSCPVGYSLEPFSLSSSDIRI